MDEIRATEVIPTGINIQTNLGFFAASLTADEVAGLQEAKVKCRKLRALMSCASAENRPTHFFRLPRAGSLSQII